MHVVQNGVAMGEGGEPSIVLVPAGGEILHGKVHSGVRLPGRRVDSQSEQRKEVCLGRESVDFSGGLS